jgi:hypothetical protein
MMLFGLVNHVFYEYVVYKSCSYFNVLLVLKFHDFRLVNLRVIDFASSQLVSILISVQI